MFYINPAVIPIVQILAMATGISIFLSAIITILYRKNPQAIVRTWWKLGILLAIIFILVGVGSTGRWGFLPVTVFLAYWAWRELLHCLEATYGIIERKLLLISLGMLGTLGGLADSAIDSIIGVGLSAWIALSVSIYCYRSVPSTCSVLGITFGTLFITTPLALLQNLVTSSYEAFAFLVLAVMGNDGFSQGWGLIGGRTPLAPTISPGKTWEGTIGGLASCAIVGYCLRFLVPDWSLLQILSVCVGMSVLSLTGDLIASSLKRNAKIKDYGTILSVTGGVLDKFDSLFFATPIFFMFHAMLHNA